MGNFMCVEYDKSIFGKKPLNKSNKSKPKYINNIPPYFEVSTTRNDNHDINSNNSDKL